MTELVDFAFYYPNMGSGNLINEKEVRDEIAKYGPFLISEHRYLGILRIAAGDNHALEIEDELGCTIQSLCIRGIPALMEGQTFEYRNFKHPEEIYFKPTSDQVLITGEFMLTEDDESFEVRVSLDGLVNGLLGCAERFIALMFEIYKSAGVEPVEPAKYTAELEEMKKLLAAN